MKLEQKKLTCPECGKEFIAQKENSAVLPFCSKRCKMIDLGQWMSEKYKVEDHTPPETIENDEET